MFIEVNHDGGSSYLDSNLVESVALSREEYSSKVYWNVWIVNTPHSFQFSSEEKARGCYEYLKAFIRY